jgi:translation initiation factor 5B
MGLSQRFMKEEMAIDVTGPGEGTVLEVKDERGFGATVDTVVYDGVIRNGDRIVVGGQNEPIVTEVRALLRPRPLAEIRTEKEFEKVGEVAAAAGVKIAAPDLDQAMAGAPVRVVRDRTVDQVVEEVKAELAEIEVETADNGVVVKADTLGSLEAMANALREAEVPILRAEVGDIAPRDIAVAETANQDEHKAILGFNVDLLQNAESDLESADVKLFKNEVIYQLVEDYERYVEEKQRAQQETVLDKVVRPARFRILPDHTFRQNDPAVVGVEVISGTLQNNRNVGFFEGNEFERVGGLSGIQKQGEDVDEARSGERVSIAIDGPTVGRGIEEGDTLWTEVPEKHAKILEQELKEEITADEREALQGYLETRRKRDPFWGK